MRQEHSRTIQPGRQLKAWLAIHGQTHREFAERLGVSAHTISKVIRSSRPSLATAVAIERETLGEIPARLWVDAA